MERKANVTEEKIDPKNPDDTNLDASSAADSQEQKASNDATTETMSRKSMRKKFR